MFAQGFRPPALLNPWEWAEANLQFPARVSPIQGPYSTTATPYVREPMEAFADPQVRKITLCWSAQSSKTTTMTIMGAYAVDQAPGDIMFVRPSLDMARSFSEGKVLPLFRENESLRKHMTGDRFDMKKCEIILDRMTWFLQGANPNQLSARSIKWLFLDETDKFEDYDTDHAEADLISLAMERLKFYRDHTAVVASTPTIPTGTVWVHFLAGDQRYFEVPCPKCGAEHRLEWKNVKWPATDDPEKIQAGTHMECPSCGGVIEERSKPAMMASGRWVPSVANPQAETKSYHLNELYSPITRWGTLAVKFVEATTKAKAGFLGPLHNFVNSSLAEPWDPIERQRRGEAEILALKDDRPAGLVPDRGVLGLAAGVDVQDLGLWYVVRAFGADLASWLILEGFAQSFTDIIRLVVEGRFRDRAGREYAVNIGLMDSGGHRTDEVYQFCRSHPVFRPSKGERRMAHPWAITKLDKRQDGSPIPGGLSLVRVNTTFYKDLLAEKIALGPDAPGSMRVHSQPSEHYPKHMTAEYRDDEGVWRCPKGRRNDLWDGEALCLCAADLVGMRFWNQEPAPDEGQSKQKNQLEQQINPFTGLAVGDFWRNRR